MDLDRRFIALEAFDRYLTKTLTAKGAQSLVAGPLGLATTAEFNYP